MAIKNKISRTEILPEVSLSFINRRPVYSFNEHQWALYSWMHALEQGNLSEGAVLLHVDAHHDLYSRPTYPQDRPNLEDLIPLLENGRIDCGNFIVPALDWGLVSQVLWLVPKHGPCSASSFRFSFHGESYNCYNYLELPFFKKDKLPYKDKFKRVTEVPNLNRPLILDLDLDYFANMELRFPDPAYLKEYYLDRRWIDEAVKTLFTDLRDKSVDPNIVTIADSDKDNLFTPHFEVGYIRKKVLEQLKHL